MLNSVREIVRDLIHLDCVSQLYLLKHDEVSKAIKDMDNLADKIPLAISEEVGKMKLDCPIILATEKRFKCDTCHHDKITTCKTKFINNIISNIQELLKG